jgi:hypothetical protein
MMRRPFRALRLALLLLAVLIVPGSAIAAKIEPVGSPAPAFVHGSDRYGAVNGDIAVGDDGTPQTITLTYANACSAKGVTAVSELKISSDGLFAGSGGGYAAAGIVTHQGITYTVRGTVVSSHVCHGATAPVTFRATTGK